MRNIEVRCRWESVATLEVEDDHPKIGSSDLDELLDASGEDVTAAGADLVDWTITDRGPNV